MYSLPPFSLRGSLVAMVLGATAFGPSVRAEEAKLAAGDYVAICGDSITEQKMYSVDMELYLLACQPAAKLEASQFGWGGETATGFLGRMDFDVLPYKPNAATLCYGMNDGGYIATDEKKLAKYKEDLGTAVRRFKAAGVRDIVMSGPGAVGNNFRSFWGTPADVYNHTLADFSEGAREVAKQEGVVFTDLHGLMVDVMTKAEAKHGRDYRLAGQDGIHPGDNGHLVMAYAYLKALGCDGNIGTLTFDMQDGTATGSTGHRIVSANGGGFEVESTKYPFCFTGDQTKPDAASKVTEFLPFNEDLNRFTLVVRNAPAGKVKVTWGSASKEFDAPELAKGVNLAAEMLDGGPFSKPFAKLKEAVERQQRYETTTMKDVLHNVPEWQKLTPERGVAFEELEKGIIGTDAALREASAKALEPVRYAVKIEAVQ